MTGMKFVSRRRTEADQNIYCLVFFWILYGGVFFAKVTRKMTVSLTVESAILLILTHIILSLLFKIFDCLFFITVSG